MLISCFLTDPLGCVSRLLGLRSQPTHMVHPSFGAMLDSLQNAQECARQMKVHRVSLWYIRGKSRFPMVLIIFAYHLYNPETMRTALLFCGKRFDQSRPGGTRAGEQSTMG